MRVVSSGNCFPFPNTTDLSACFSGDVSDDGPEDDVVVVVDFDDVVVGL